jgi:hypothetical protein
LGVDSLADPQPKAPPSLWQILFLSHTIALQIRIRLKSRLIAWIKGITTPYPEHVLMTGATITEKLGAMTTPALTIEPWNRWWGTTG